VTPHTGELRVLVVDDERPALDEVQYLLDQDDRVGEVMACDSATEALRTLHEREVDAVFLDIQMPGLTGLELAQVLKRFRRPPPVVFITAHEEHAVDAFELRAVDYVLKPVRAERLADAVSRIIEGGDRAPAPVEQVQIPVELGGVTRFVDRSDVTHVEAHGDYVRLHTAEGAHLIRVPLTTLETEWAGAGFVRIHRSLLVALGHVTEIRMESGRCTVAVGPRDHPTELVVARRHTRELRELLGRRATSSHASGHVARDP